MDKERLLDDLNDILSLEYTAALQYTYQSFAVRGLHTPHLSAFFQAEANEALTHSRAAGTRIIALGGVPTTEVGAINPTTDLREMLEHDLTIEQAAVDAYCTALSHAGDNTALRTYLEGQIEVEQASVETIRRYLD